jgi:hypothetical protein
MENLPNEEFHNVYTSPNIIKENKSIKIKWTEYVTSEEVRNACKICLKTWTKATSQQTGEDIKIALQDVRLRCNDVNWTHLAPDNIKKRAPVYTVMNLRVH